MADGQWVEEHTADFGPVAEPPIQFVPVESSSDVTASSQPFDAGEGFENTGLRSQP